MESVVEIRGVEAAGEWVGRVERVVSPVDASSSMWFAYIGPACVGALPGEVSEAELSSWVAEVFAACLPAS